MRAPRGARSRRTARARRSRCSGCSRATARRHRAQGAHSRLGARGSPQQRPPPQRQLTAALRQKMVRLHSSRCLLLSPLRPTLSQCAAVTRSTYSILTAMVLRTPLSIGMDAGAGHVSNSCLWEEGSCFIFSTLQVSLHLSYVAGQGVLMGAISLTTTLH